MTKPLTSLALSALLATPALPLWAATCEDRIEDYESRITLCAAEAAAAANPDDAAVALGYQGEAERMLGRLDQAEATLQQALSLSPRNGWYWVELGHVRFDGGDVSGALGHYGTALELSPGDPYPLINRADAWSVLGAPDRCLTDSAAALAIDPGYTYAHLIHARCLIGTGRADEALTHLDPLIAADPAWLDPALARVQALTDLGRPAEAVASADQALAAAGGGDGGAADALLIARLRANIDLMPLDALLAEADGLASRLADAPDLADARARALLKAGRVDEAETAAAPLAALSGTLEMSGYFHDTLARIDLARGRTDAALRNLGRALALEPRLAKRYARQLSEQGYLPLSIQTANLVKALMRCFEERGQDCRVGG